jgi:hypothetical protein
MNYPINNIIGCLFEEIGVDKLGDAIVHDFIENFVDQNEVLPYIVLIELSSEVGFADFDLLYVMVNDFLNYTSE